MTFPQNAELFERVLRGHSDLAGGRVEPALAWTPGRIEFLGKHTDYAGGRSLLCAVDRGIALAFSPRKDRRLRIRDARDDDTIECEVDPALEPTRGHWATYATTLARRVARNFPGALGADIVFASDLPAAAGMSSSSALTVGLFLALANANGLTERDEYRRYLGTVEELAGYLGAIENGQGVPGLPGDRGVGTLSGCEDQTAILAGRPGSLIRASFCPVHIDATLPLPDGYTFVVATSGVTAEKTGGALEKYNDVSRKAAAVLDRWREATGRDDASLAAAIQSSADAADRLRRILRDANDARYSRQELLDRFEQFVAESEEIIPAVSDALVQGDLDRLGALVDRSQAGAERLLGNQIDETRYLARAARDLGAVAASAFGAGFGGSVWALVSERDAGDLAADWEARYAARFPAHSSARFFMTRAGPAAQIIR